MANITDIFFEVSKDNAWARPGKTGQDRARPGKTEQDRTRLEKTGKGKTSLD